MITLTITLHGAERAISIDPDELPLGFFEDAEEAQETGKFRPLIRAYGEMLGLTPAEMRVLTVRQFRAISEALRDAGAEATAIPNASGGA